MRRIQLRRQLREITDWPLDDLREERDKQQHPRNVLLRRAFLPVDIHQVSHGLERIKRDAQRRNQPQGPMDRPAAQQRCRPVELGQHKVAILKHSKQAEIQKQRRDHNGLAPGLVPSLIGLLFLPAQLFLIRFQISLLLGGQAADPTSAAIGRERGKENIGPILQPSGAVENGTGQKQQHPLPVLWYQKIKHRQSQCKEQKAPGCDRH